MNVLEALAGIDTLMAVAEKAGLTWEGAKALILRSREEGRELTGADIEEYTRQRHEAEAQSREKLDELRGRTD